MNLTTIQGPFCGDCRRPCKVIAEDIGFAHAFGYEERTDYSSACCGAEAFDDPELSSAYTGDLS
jgi:hypothetical protein